MLDDKSGSRWTLWSAPAVIVAVAAVVMGLPTLGGSFVGGDDHRLVLNHVLVNHPSLAHAARLFTIVHRDLYQPLPLLSFSVEFAAAKAFGLFDESVAGGARMFHLTNVILHAFNAVLVWAVIVRLHERIAGVGLVRDSNLAPAVATPARAPSVSWDAAGSASVVATVAALLFAIHPLQTEVVAWLNGRMMLMSTLFALASLLTFASWLDRPRNAWAFLTVAFVLLSAVSKVRIGLPVLLLIVALARRARLDRGLILLWVACSLVTGIFVLVNVQATAGAALFSEAAEHLHGPRAVRVLLALACYFQHLVWPVGLASYYPTPPVVRWSDPGTWQAAMVVVPALVAFAWACRRSRVARLGLVWFFVTIGATLPFVPARNVLAADRYMYLPIIGLFWLVATAGYAAYHRWLAPLSPRLGRIVVVLLCMLVVPACVGMSWHVSWFYATPFRKTQRIAELFPTTPRVWERLGWSYYSSDNYAKAIECAQKELQHDSPNVRSGAYQLLGMSELRLGNGEVALEHLHTAIELDPRNPLGKYRLAMAYEQLGHLSEALPYYEAAVDTAPSNNPTIKRLASAYRRLGRPADARAAFEKALVNNPYEVPATMGLIELDIAQATPESYLTAERRLVTLLDWMPENTTARVNLGVVRAALGRTAEAIEAYKHVLGQRYTNRTVATYVGMKERQDQLTAALNLAQLYHAAGDVDRARPLFERAAAELVRDGLVRDGRVRVGLVRDTNHAPATAIDQVIVVHDFYVTQGAADRAVSLWLGFVERFPDSVEGHAFAAWSYALSGAMEQARTRAEALTLVGDCNNPPPPPHAPTRDHR